MPKYTYECLDNMHQKEVKHGMFEEPDIVCELCGAAMIKLPPQNTTIAIAPFDILLEKSNKKYGEYRQRKRKERK